MTQDILDKELVTEDDLGCILSATKDLEAIVRGLSRKNRATNKDYLQGASLAELQALRNQVERYIEEAIAKEVAKIPTTGSIELEI